MTASRAPLLTLYGRPWCHLCDDMLAELEPLLAEFGARVGVVDVDVDPVLEARYNERVPVLACEGVELCHYRLDAARVRAGLAERAPRDCRSARPGRREAGGRPAARPATS